MDKKEFEDLLWEIGRDNGEAVYCREVKQDNERAAHFITRGVKSIDKATQIYAELKAENERLNSMIDDLEDERSQLVLKLYENEQVKGEWLPYPENIPHCYATEYLVTRNRAKPYTDRLRWWGDGDWEMDNVIAFRPMPEPYQPESESE